MLCVARPTVCVDLNHQVRPKVKDKAKGMADILELIQDRDSGCHNATGIVYCMTQVRKNECHI